MNISEISLIEITQTGGSVYNAIFRLGATDEIHVVTTDCVCIYRTREEYENGEAPIDSWEVEERVETLNESYDLKCDLGYMRIYNGVNDDGSYTSFEFFEDEDALVFEESYAEQVVFDDLSW